MESLCDRPAAEAPGSADGGFASQFSLPEGGPIAGCAHAEFAPVGLRIAAEAELWIGTPFVWQGRIRQVGCDCKGLVAGVFAALGRPEAVSVEALAGDYGEHQAVPVARLRSGLANLFEQVWTPAAGDIVLLVHAGLAQHLGIALDRRSMVHAMSSGPGQVVRATIGGGRLDSVWRVKPDG